MAVIRCDPCDREFRTQEALDMHNSAKHGAPSKTGISGSGWKTIVYIAGFLLVVFVGYVILSGAGLMSGGASDPAIPLVGPGSDSGGGLFAQGVVDGSPQKVTIGFNGGYYPDTIRVKAGRPVEISLDSSVRGCYRSFNIDAFGVSKRSSGPSDTIRFIPDQKGAFEYRCGMGMGRGTIIVQ